jgi:hypothetical protein
MFDQNIPKTSTVYKGDDAMPIQPETPITMTDSDHFLHRVVFILVHFK